MGETPCGLGPAADEITKMAKANNAGAGEEIKDHVHPEKIDAKVSSVKDSQDADHELYGHLPPTQAKILRDQVFTPDVKVGLYTLYRYASRNDLLLIAVGALAAIVSGAAMPLMTVIFASLQSVLQAFFVGQGNYDELTRSLTQTVLYFVYLGIGEFVCAYASTVIFIYTGEHISAKIRQEYLESCMRQNIAFFDKLGAGEVTTRITADTNRIQAGISEKISFILTAMATFVAAFVIGFIEYWKLTLILTSSVFALLLVIAGGSLFVVKYTKQNMDAYAEGGSLVEEVISSVRNAIAFGTQDRLAKLYDAQLTRAESFGFRAKSAIGIMAAGTYLVSYLTWALVFWMGSRFLIDGVTTVNKILIIAMSVIMAAFELGMVAPDVQALTDAISAVAKIYTTIDRLSPLDPLRNEGAKIENLRGHIRLEHVRHIYPSRPKVVVMEDMSLEVPAGRMTALVGSSGSGKSTVIGLLERFYLPVEGRVYLDGVDISTLNLRWLRQQISLVSQEPILFGTSIYENIRHGLIGTEWENECQEKQRERIWKAARKANAHDFVLGLPEGYDTNVGERGFLLSGGQKQRVAIARAIVSDPKILLLDEATSALDTKSEGVVQAALEAAAAGRTTITIAHRLSTIKDAHNIVVMEQGRIVEQGTHNQLLENKAAYYHLVTAQAIAAVNGASPAEKDASTQNRASGTEEGSDGYQENTKDNMAFQLVRSRTNKSASSLAVTSRKEEEEPRYGLWALIKLIAGLNRHERWLMLIGLFFCIMCGATHPAFAVLFSKLIAVLSVPINAQTIPSVQHDASFWCGMFLVLAWAGFIAFSIQGIILARCSERLVHRARDQAFRAMLRQDVGFFDREENSVGALTAFLSTETTHVAGLSGVTLGTIATVLTTLLVAYVLALAIGWKLALVCIATTPLMLACGFLRFFMLAQFAQRSKKAYAASASYASEAITAICTVASLAREEDVLRQYRDLLARQQRASLFSILKSSTLYAASRSLMFVALALGFWYGGNLITQHEYSMFQFFVVFMSVVFGAQSAGTIFSFAPDMGKASEASRQLKVLLDRKPAIDTWSQTGERLDGVEGNLEFRNVHFRYPTRPEQLVLRGLSLTINRGQYVALVGASGCGKSTTIALLERFYDPLSGGIFMDGKDISRLNVNDYRSFIALVSQEPTLYQGTIRENILLGAPHAVTEAQVEFACREANIYDFVISLPDGLNTVVGSKGALLSGGQKQRIAIARALVRDPRILLLDEATSALDSESEHVVQAALDKAAQGRTTIAVAHRLSTIQKADVIYFLDQGRVVEHGTHVEMMKRNGRYAELVGLQSLERQK